MNELQNIDKCEVIVEENEPLLDMSVDNILVMAEKADKMVTALNKIMRAALMATTNYDWVNIGGKPYLQESGATKVARLFGIAWKINDGYPIAAFDSKGYPTYTYRMTFQFNGQDIEAEGSRNAYDDFFTGKDHSKPADAIDFSDVKKSAFTNCLNRGIKAIVPGLRNIRIETLQEAGIDVQAVNGYTFKEGAKGGTVKTEENSGLVCEDCGKAISQKVASYSEGKFGGHRYCMEHQKIHAND